MTTELVICPEIPHPSDGQGGGMAVHEPWAVPSFGLVLGGLVTVGFSFHGQGLLALAPFNPALVAAGRTVGASGTLWQPT